LPALLTQKIAASGSSYRDSRFPVGAAEGCDLLILSFLEGTFTPSWEFPKKISMLRPTFASTRPAAPIAPTRQMIFSPSPTAGRKIRVYVLKAGAVYQK